MEEEEEMVVVVMMEEKRWTTGTRQGRRTDGRELWVGGWLGKASTRGSRLLLPPFGSTSGIPPLLSRPEPTNQPTKRPARLSIRLGSNPTTTTNCTTSICQPARRPSCDPDAPALFSAQPPAASPTTNSSFVSRFRFSIVQYLFISLHFQYKFQIPAARLAPGRILVYTKDWKQHRRQFKADMVLTAERLNAIKKDQTKKHWLFFLAHPIPKLAVTIAPIAP
ncbi:hypothetical protein IWX90DRAFT_415023 [Phyllosticta citrichinensis]|uniref:Uncharacterized protein n=1 Tax=Phyllosticta citrichinensis TaxID=1130410 RepID=A0ABR1XTM5_9PEZI